MKDKTNREFADWLEIRSESMDHGLPKSCVVISGEAALDIARRLRSLPDPTPEPLTLRALVEKHECLSVELAYHEGDDPIPWRWETNKGHKRDWLTDDKALTVVRGIVKAKCDNAKCDERSGILGLVRPDGNRWYCYFGGKYHYFDTELEAIDALLTAMQ